MRIRRRDQVSSPERRRYVYVQLGRRSQTADRSEATDPAAAEATSPANSQTQETAQAPSLEEVRREGYERGFQEGYERGFQEAAERVQTELTSQLEEHFNSLLSALKEGAEAIVQAREKVVEQMEAWVPRAALLLSEYVLQRELSQDKNAVIELLRRSLQEVAPSGPVRVHLNPNDFERLAEQPREVWNTEQLTFVPDEAVSQGGAIIETDNQVIDARLESRLIEAARHLLFPEEVEERSE